MKVLIVGSGGREHTLSLIHIFIMGILTLVAGIVVGVGCIINAAFLMKRKSEITF